MSKEKVFIVVTHKNSLKAGTKDVWEVTELVEFVNQLRRKHVGLSSAIGDYINRKMITGGRVGMGDYNKFEEYIRGKYKEQMSQLDAAYRDAIAEAPAEQQVFVDLHGNVRAKTVFDPA